MKLTLLRPYLLLAIIAGALLFAQIFGVHRHLHTGTTNAFQLVASELHFADAGIHNDDHHDFAAGGHHAHDDVEIDGLGEALVKLILKLLPIGLLMLVVMRVRVPRHLPRPRETEPPPRRHPFSLHPPANGPPRRLSTAV